MPTITREDGTVFTVANYRSNITVAKPSLMKGELRFLASQHGNKVCVVRINDQEVEGVFSKDDGYPLGELIWDYLDRKESLLYVEALTKERANEAVLVVVRDNRVFVDAIIEKDFMRDEFSSLVAENIPMDIHVFGDVPIGETANDDKFAFPEELVKSFNYCDSSVFEELTPKPEFELVDPIEAIKRSNVLPRAVSPLVAVLGIAALIGGYYAYTVFTKEEVQIIQEVVRVDPYKEYLTQLQKPTVLSQFDFISQSMRTIYALQGWKPVKLIYLHDEMQVEIQPELVPDVRALTVWAKVYDITYELGDNKSIVKFTSELPNRKDVKTIRQLLENISDLFEEISSNVISAKILIKSPTSKGNYRTAPLEIQLDSASPAILTVLGNIFYGKTATLDKVDLTVNANGSYSGKIELTVLGK